MKNEKGVDLGGAFPENTDADEEQHNADDGCGERFVLAMAVVVVMIPRAGRKPDAEEDNEIRCEVRKRMDCVGHHGAAMPAHAGYEFEE